MFRRVLIVCHANVCRSPAAEMLFRAHAGKLAGQDARRWIEFRSAGLFAKEGAQHRSNDVPLAGGA